MTTGKRRALRRTWGKQKSIELLYEKQVLPRNEILLCYEVFKSRSMAMGSTKRLKKTEDNCRKWIGTGCRKI